MFQSVRQKKIFEEILDQIKEMLANEQLVVGQKIPPETLLAEMLNVSRSSLREALRVLNVLGIIEAKTGEGTVIRHTDPENLKNLLTLVAVSQGINTLELYEARRAIEVEAAGLAAVRRTEENLQKMHLALLEMDKSNNADSSQFDYVFHREIVNATRNNTMIMLISFISGLMGEQITDTRKQLSPYQDIMVKIQEQHWEIYKGIRDKNPEWAREKMHEHLLLAQKLLNFNPRNKKSLMQSDTTYKLQ